MVIAPWRQLDDNLKPIDCSVTYQSLGPPFLGDHVENAPISVRKRAGSEYSAEEAKNDQSVQGRCDRAGDHEDGESNIADMVDDRASVDLRHRCHDQRAEGEAQNIHRDNEFREDGFMTAKLFHELWHARREEG